MNSHIPAAAAAGTGGGPGVTPLRSGAVPSLADCFSTRAETGPGPAGDLGPGRPLVLTAPAVPARPVHDWPGGTGKTQLAAYLAHTWWQARQLDLLVWVTASSRASVLSGYVQALAERTGTVPAGDAEAAAARFLSFLAGTQRWLVVLDDMSDPADLAGLWPRGPGGRVIVTTPNEAIVPESLSPLVFRVGPFSSHEALTYLMARLSDDPDQRVGAVDLLHDLGREPLALVQASATIASSGFSCRHYRELFARRQQQIADATGAQPAAKAVTWTLSVEQADLLSPGGVAQHCLALAVLLDCHGIPGSVFTTPSAAGFIAGPGAGGAPDPKQARSALLSLERTGLLTIDPDSTARTVQVHPVVQAAVRAATPGSMREAAAKAAAAALLQAWPADGEQPHLADALRSCAASLEQAAADALWTGGSHRILFRAGQSLDGARLTGLAVSYWRALASTCERVLGPAHPDTLLAADRLASAALATGLGDYAVALCQRALDSRAGVLGPAHPSTLAARADLGAALLAAGRPGDAIMVLEEVLATREPGWGADGTDGLALQDTLAAAYQAAGAYAEAIRLAGRTLAAREQRQGPDHPDTMATRRSLGRACLAAGRLKDAIAHYRRTLAGCEQVLGPGHPDTIAAASALASACHSARRLKDALPLYERVVAGTERLQGPDHPDTIGARGNLASVYHSVGRMASALELYERTRADCQRVLGPHHPDTLAARANLAQAYYATGRMTEALKLLRHTLADCEQVLPPGDPLTTAVRESLEAVDLG